MKRISDAWRIFVGLLMELSDQAAYRRHLAAHGREDSGSEWRRFAEERLASKFIRPRCC